MADLRSAPLPPLSPDDHIRGPVDAPLVVAYGDYECPFCAALEERLRVLALRVAFRHFPVRGSHPRAFPAACAAEAAERLGLDVARFEADRRELAIAERVTADFRAGVRAGVAATPTLFFAGERHT